MRTIEILDQNTIDQIAAGEVVERPASVVKELVENAIDAQASAVTVEIRDGGISLIRVTDNGVGIPAAEVPVAFTRHATSKIRHAEDLRFVASLGFRGEALSSIASVSRMEMITKTADEISGTRHRIEGGMVRGTEEIGAPNGTSIFVRDLFFNTPARAKFLCSVSAETTHIIRVMEALALANPTCSIRLIANGATRLFTGGNGSLDELVHAVFGAGTSAHMIPVSYTDDILQIRGLIGSPEIARGNRNAEHYFINGRYVRHRRIAAAIEEGYRGKLMQHRYPFVLLYLEVDPSVVDVNVHPSKMEVRISDEEPICEALTGAVQDALGAEERIPRITLPEAKREKEPEVESAPAPEEPHSDGPAGNVQKTTEQPRRERTPEPFEQKRIAADSEQQRSREARLLGESAATYETGTQETLFSSGFLEQRARAKHRVVGQVFSTYWIVEYEDTLYLIDQHAAHEKVLYERLMAAYRARTIRSQQVEPAAVVTLGKSESELISEHPEPFEALGFSLEYFGGTSWRITAVPADLSRIRSEDLFTEILAHLDEEPGRTPEQLLDRLATMACKAAVKGNQELSFREADALIGALLELEDPYHCPHGRPTIISMTQRELDRKFKRIL